MTETGTTDTARDYERSVRIEAAPDSVFDALTTPDGLSAWWTSATGDGRTDGELSFTFDPTQVMVVHVEEAAPERVRWRVLECPFLPDWDDTRPVFTMAGLDASTTELRLRHHGLTDELDCIDMCTQGWNFFLDSLRRYLETGVGSPVGSRADRERRAHRDRVP